MLNGGNALILIDAVLISLLLTLSSYLSMWNIHVRIKYSETPEQRPILAGALKRFPKINVEPDCIRVVKLILR